MATDKSAEKKVMDVSRPSQTTAGATSRPVIVTNRPLMQDPMMSAVLSGKSEPEQPVEAKTEDKPATASLTGRAEKIIKPPEAGEPESEPEAEAVLPTEADGSAKEATEEVTAAEDSADEAEATEASQEAKKPEPVEAEEKPAPQQDVADDVETDEDSDDDKQTNPKAVKISEADLKRSAELEEVIASGKYNVPINATGKRRTLIITVWLFLLTLILIAVLLDALLDVGMLNLQSIPHTHFFSI